MEDRVILVDEHDTEVGTSEKLRAHELGLLHRALSIFIFNTNGDLLLQKRAAHKYHSAGLWSNTCCSHPRPGESILAAAHRRLQEEMGFDCPLEEKFAFTYRAELPGSLVEHEYDHVLVGTYDSDPVPNPEEASDFKWVGMEWLRDDLVKNSSKYTTWLSLCLEHM